jgi:hypothetical protein
LVEDTKDVFWSSTLKADRQHNGRNKKNKDLQNNIQKLKIPHLRHLITPLVSSNFLSYTHNVFHMWSRSTPLCLVGSLVFVYCLTHYTIKTELNVFTNREIITWEQIFPIAIVLYHQRPIIPIKLVHIIIGLVIIPRPPYWPETQSRANMGPGMITRPIWKCPCIKLFITYFQHLEKRRPSNMEMPMY